MNAVSVRSYPIITMDLMATALDVLGMESFEGRPLDGGCCSCRLSALISVFLSVSAVSLLLSLSPLSLSLSLSLSLFLSRSRSASLGLCSCLYVSVFLSLYLSVCLPACLSAYLPACLSVLSCLSHNHRSLMWCAAPGLSLLPVLRGEQRTRPTSAGIGIHGSFPYGDTNHQCDKDLQNCHTPFRCPGILPTHLPLSPPT